MNSPSTSGSWFERLLIPVLVAVLVFPVEAQTDRLEWTELREISDLTGLVTALNEAALEDPDLRSNATSLGYKSALFLASGSVDTPRLGATQRIESSYLGGGDLEDQRKATVEVQFLGYDDGRARFGERFEIALVAGVGKTWKVQRVGQASCKRTPLRARRPESGKFRDFLEAAELRGGGCEYEHEDIPRPIRIRIEDLNSVDPVDPVVLRLKGNGVMWDDTPNQRTELGAKLVDYRRLCELVNERPKVMIVALGDVRFADGIGVLAELSSAGIHEVYLPAPRPPHPPHPGRHERLPPRPTKPHPPAELFRGQ